MINRMLHAAYTFCSFRSDDALLNFTSTLILRFPLAFWHSEAFSRIRPERRSFLPVSQSTPVAYQDRDAWKQLVSIPGDDLLMRSTVTIELVLYLLLREITGCLWVLGFTIFHRSSYLYRRQGLECALQARVIYDQVTQQEVRDARLK